MTENDAIRYLEITKTLSEDNTVRYLQRQMCETAISALKEVQQYREIGTVEQVKNQKENLKVAYKNLEEIPCTDDAKYCPRCGSAIYVYYRAYGSAKCMKCGFNFRVVRCEEE